MSELHHALTRVKTCDLWRLSSEAIITALDHVCSELGDPSNAFGQEARDQLHQSTGLSVPMIDWALATSLPKREELVPRNRDSLHISAALDAALGVASPRNTGRIPSATRLDRDADCSPRYATNHGSGGLAPDTSSDRDRGFAVVVLAGNVFTAAIRPLFHTLLSHTPVVAKASSRENALPHILEAAVNRTSIAGSLAVVAFPRGHHALEAKLFGDASHVSVFGSDETVAALQLRVPTGVPFSGYGHGVGAAFVSAVDRTNESLASRLALDITAYDQRGCLSPQWVFVEGDRSIALDFAVRLADQGLGPLGVNMPRGTMTEEEYAAQIQWRGVVRATGTLLERSDFAVAIEEQKHPRPTPGLRNVVVTPCPGGLAEFVHRVSPWGPQLKAVGLSDISLADQVRAHLLSTRITAIGAMQILGFNECVDPDVTRR